MKNNPNKNSNPPTVFISYSYDNDKHKLWVLNFFNDLKNNGVDAIIDFFHLSRYENDLILFMESGIRDSDYVIIVATPQYAIKANKRIGGVGIESTIITGEYFDEGKREKFLPIIREGNDQFSDCRPSYLQTQYCYDFRKNENYDIKLEELLRFIHNIPLVEEPELGNKPTFKTYDIETYTEMIMKTPSKTESNLNIFQITEPSNEIVDQEIVRISGTGAPNNMGIIIINELPNKSCWLQQGYAVPDSNGYWAHRGSHITKGDIDRKIHAIAIPISKINNIYSIFDRASGGGYFLQFNNFEEILLKIREISGEIQEATPIILKRL